MKINYQSELDKIIHKVEESAKIPSLLLHSCCGPCSSYVLEYLSDYFAITVFYYNPNIYPEDEYWFRVDEQERLIKKLTPKHPIHFISGKYETEKYYRIVKGLSQEREGGERCQACYDLRLTEAALLAKENNFDYFTTTLTISPHKNSQILNEIGERIGQEYGVKHLPSDFKKRGGYQRSVELSRQFDMYRQDYCGCAFSMKEAESRKKNT
ncbi:hypothetical protein EII17_02165 [Clostridiales bacterium COT073_COT-073]|nr:hypothetical protein EII17_02165 [Clostridiales bacterium COT073_COT-073]